MYAKASSDDTAKHKTCINNAKIMQNQSRKKCTENAKTSHQRMPWNAKKMPKKKAKKMHLSTKPMQKTHNKCQKNMHKKCNKNAQKMQSKSKTHAIKHVLVFAFAFFSLYLRFFLRKRKKNRKTSTNNAQKMQKTHATTSHKKCKKIAQKKWCVKFGCACACFLLFLNCCSAFFLLFFSGILFACFLLFDMHSF